MDPETTKRQIEWLDFQIGAAPGQRATPADVAHMTQAKLALVEAYAIQVEVAALEPGCGCED
jgi:hypothetical protein